MPGCEGRLDVISFILPHLKSRPCRKVCVCETEINNQVSAITFKGVHSSSVKVVFGKKNATVSRKKIIPAFLQFLQINCGVLVEKELAK